MRYFSSEKEKNNFLQQARVNTDSVIQLGNTSYDVKEKWIIMASGYFDTDTGNITANINGRNPINLLKAGLFGYINEINAHEIKNAIYHRNVMYDELFLNSASFPNSIYNFAKLYNVPITMAQPSTMKVVLSIRKDDLLRLPNRRVTSSDFSNDKTLRTYEIVINRNQKFNIENFNFLLPYDVKILINENLIYKNNEQVINNSISARYDIDHNIFPFITLNNSNLKVMKDTVNGIEYYHFYLDIFQIDRDTTEYNITDRDFDGNMYFDVSYSGQLAGFNVYYEHLGKRETLEMYFNNTFSPDTNNPFCYYSFTDDDRITISFSNLNNSFRPAVNSKIIVDTLTTEGSLGNFTYNQEVNLKLDSSNNAFDNIPISIVPITSSSNGSNKPSVNDEKQKIVNKILTRESVIMDSDIDNYFEEMNDRYSLNGSNIKFFKKRNDILDRTYSAYLLLRDRDGKVLPTTTATKVDIENKYLTGNSDFGNEVDGYVVPENSVFIYNYNSGKYEFLPFGRHDENLIADYLKDRNSLVYINPYMLKIDKDPFLMTNYFKLDIDKYFNLNYNFINSLSPFNISVDDIHVEKINNFPKNLDSDTFRVTIEIDLDNSAIGIDEDIKLRGVLTSATSGEKYGYFELERKDSEDVDRVEYQNVFEGFISTNRKFRDNKLSISKSLYNSEGKMIENAYIDEKLDLHIAVLYKTDDIKYFSNKDKIDNEYLFNDKFPASANEDINDYSLLMAASADENVTIYENMSNIMRSIVTEGSNNFSIEMIPLVSLDYFVKEDRTVHGLLDNYQEILTSSLPKLENNTNVDMKFYNTRGPSKNFFIDVKLVDDNQENVYLSRTDILLDFDIHLFHGIDDEQDREIKAFISDFVEECNEEGLLPISNLIRLLEQNFDVIKYIEFNGISGKYEENVDNYYQKAIDSSKDLVNLSKEEIMEYVPEYLNLKKEIRDNLIQIYDRDVIDNVSYIDYGRRYENVININYVNMRN